ncbi:hypothetical protein HORIV_54070 [Vreelandella olivaria]|uniref:Uncharacterized protein n=1 Tax=Vreelandella olivaria TaxID=390919 RepID=A0ABM7GQ86_9GAMM|nr:hypothetical protein HORIV_54070 [Halomonas olivaria]
MRKNTSVGNNERKPAMTQLVSAVLIQPMATVLSISLMAPLASTPAYLNKNYLKTSN